MEYRCLGRTGLQVSVLGIGSGYIMLLDIEEGRKVYQRAIDLGINYLDGRYGASSTMISPLLKGRRDKLIIVTKTAETTAEGAMGRIEEDLEELGTDYLDIFYLRAYTHAMMDQHLAPGGSLEGLIKAKEQGKIRNIGLSNHSDFTALARGIETGVVDAAIFPLNIARREALHQVIPVAQRHNVGLVVMKPVSVGMIPPHIALPWLANQPIHTMLPGVSNIAQLEANARALNRSPMALSPEEEAEVAHWSARLDTATCHICDQVCQPVCEAHLSIDGFIYHDVFYNQYRNLGLEGFISAPMAPWVRMRAEEHFVRRLEGLKSCTHCGKCEQVCPYHLPIMDMLDKMAEDHVPVIEAVRAAGWTEQYKDATAPFMKGRRS